MKMIPPVVFAGTSSDAERKLFALLERASLGPHARALHSLNISEHEYKLVGELDFVVLSLEGLLVLEVKGGGVACHEGLWTFTDRFGREHRTSEGPFQQARTGMFSLRARLRSDLHSSATSKLTFGYGVVFPDIDFRDSSVEWAPEMVIDREKLVAADRLSEALSNLQQYWKKKKNGPSDASVANLDSVSQLLRPEFDRVPSLRHRATELLASMQALTEEQYHQLDLVEEAQRLLCTGGAGTGKTFLAVEVARREAAREARVLLTCKSHVLASFLAGRVSVPGVAVLPLDKAIDANAEPYDVLVLDEAQDILDFESLEQVSTLVAGGLEAGRWRMFCDGNNQSSVFGNFDPEALEYLRSLAGAGGMLQRNCRNTRDIVIQTKLVTHADLGMPSAGHGPPVEWAFFDDDISESKLLAGHLSRLIDDDVLPGDVTILSPLPFDASCVSRMAPKWRRRIQILDAGGASEWPLREITFATITDFKGLENTFIVVVDIDSLATERDLSLLYIAMSRARAGLWIALPERLRDELTSLQQAELSAVMGEAENA